MKTVSMYEAEDGKLFKTSEEAILHENECEIKKWYEDNKLYGNYDGSSVDYMELKSWLTENRRYVDTIIKAGEHD